MLQGITEEVKKQTEERISSRYIMYIHGIHDIAGRKTKGADAVEILKDRKNSKKAKDPEIHADLRVLGRDLQTVRPARLKGGDADHPPQSTFVDVLEKSLETEVPPCLVRRSHGRDISLIRRAWLDIAASSSAKRNNALRPVI